MLGQEILNKARKYCAYQERAHQEVRRKLFDWKVEQEDAENIISQLITEGFLNEERFALAFASGKFRIKKWGRNRIAMELRQKGVSDYCVSQALKSLDPDEYDNTLSRLIEEKMRTVKAPNEYAKNNKIAGYCLRKGYEGDLVWDKIRSFGQED